ncbi:hypothetical protein ACFOWA_14160 [Pedobacter lithocola]|uniref:Uncharacterized protein n=1 Tax=Pedobacter lithocola TaxID=1908239 RepID=A0ABV8PE12_9SPHI
MTYEAFGNNDDSSAELIYQLVRSGAKVKIQKRNTFKILKVVQSFKNGIPANLKQYQHERHSSQQLITYGQTFCFGIANPGAIWIDKSEMIKLQLQNSCSSVSLFLFIENIHANTASAYQKMDVNRMDNGYLISGPICCDGSQQHLIRNISDLTVNLLL